MSLNKGRPPKFSLLAMEGPSLIAAHAKGRMGQHVRLPRTETPATILVIPGFLSDDGMTLRLRKSLRASGHRAHGWGLGRNLGIRADLLERIGDRLKAVEEGLPNILIGWSLGGVIAREYAKHDPCKIAQVITLGSPFSGSVRDNNAWRVYEKVAGHPAESPPIAAILHQKPPVPTIALWSKSDGVVAAHSARGRAEEADADIELNCRHMAMVSNADAIRTIADVIENPPAAGGYHLG